MQGEGRIEKAFILRYAAVHFTIPKKGNSKRPFRSLSGGTAFCFFTFSYIGITGYRVTPIVTAITMQTILVTSVDQKMGIYASLWVNPVMDRSVITRPLCGRQLRPREEILTTR